MFYINYYDRQALGNGSNKGDEGESSYLGKEEAALARVSPNRTVGGCTGRDRVVPESWEAS